MSQAAVPQEVPGHPPTTRIGVPVWPRPAGPFRPRAILERLATGYYDRLEVLDRTARLMLRDASAALQEGRAARQAGRGIADTLP
jgi:hypothetical protein